MSSEENQKSASTTNKDQDSGKESIDTTAEVQHHSNPLLKSVRDTKQIVATRPPRSANHRAERALDDTASSRGALSRSAPYRKQRDEGLEEIRGRNFRDRRVRGRVSKPGRNQGRGAAGKYVFFSPFSSAQNCLMEMDINRAPIGSIRHALFTLLS